MATKLEQYENNLLKAIQLTYPKVRDCDLLEYYADKSHADKACRKGETVVCVVSFGMYCVIDETALS